MNGPIKSFPETIDITSEICPMTFVKTKLALEKLSPGARLVVRLQGKEPLRNVPKSIREMGVSILSFEREEGESEYGIHQIVLEAKT